LNKVVDLKSEALNRLKNISATVPHAAVVLGSGIDVLNNLIERASYSFKDIFGVAPSVQGHLGTIELGKLDNKLIAILRGRYHLYEGHDFDTVTLPTSCLAEWGVGRLYLTNAAGALNPDFSVGDLMLITGYRDHLSPNWKNSGGLPAITAPLTNCQNKLTKSIWENAKELQLEKSSNRRLQQGAYAGVLGPCYETLAEVTMYKRLGADAVGMSTIPELQAAHKYNLPAAAISVITNSWNEAKIHSHLEVLEEAKAASQRLDKILQKAILSD
jgi:purine-nucleoside phosphorylase